MCQVWVEGDPDWGQQTPVTAYHQLGAQPVKGEMEAQEPQVGPTGLVDSWARQVQMAKVVLAKESEGHGWGQGDAHRYIFAEEFAVAQCDPA